MDAAQIYDFIFNTYAGVGILMATVFVIALLAAVILERKTRRKYVDRGERKGFSLFSDDDEDEEDAADDGKADS